ncbi:adenylosuccinate synthetase [Mesorhizobium sp. M0293]|uniref:adenylosuccinate synthetase n=1 Tax=Mesorhizobium sp. M0293 TaxID=2956930 RepID=UPI003337D6E0
MPVTVVVGGQFGSEGKGKVSAYLARTMRATAVVRVGGPNSGHSAVDERGTLHTLRQLPAGAVGTDTQIVLPAGSLINPDILLAEIRQLGVTPARLRIDSKASLVTKQHIEEEASGDIVARIASTGSGTGAALMDRLSRSPNHLLVKDFPELAPFMEEDISWYLRGLLQKGQRIVVEGTQGFGLSVWHSADFPYATSRDTTAAGFLAEAGLAPHDVDDVAMVLRTYPIRVGGNSGPLPKEISWGELAVEAKLPPEFVEYTTATHRVRRVARFDSLVVNRAIASNQPHRIFLNHMDYVDPQGKNELPSVKSRDFLRGVEAELNRSVDFVGYGPEILIPRSSLFLREAI